MGIRFRKSIKLPGGVRLNLSKRGVGLSASIPGTGVSFVASPGRRKGAQPRARAGAESTGCGLLAMVFAGIFAVGILSSIVRGVFIRAFGPAPAVSTSK